jgi:hypothetical protein
LDEPLGRSVRGGEEKNSQPLPELEPPIIQPAAERYTTELTEFCSLFNLNVLRLNSREVKDNSEQFGC